MITRDYMKTMAAYNQWQNESLYGAAANLSDEARKADRGAFFGSILGTLNHLLWGDKIWLNRFGVEVPIRQGSIPTSTEECETWEELVAQRQMVDGKIIDWAEGYDEAELGTELSWYSPTVGRDVSKPRGQLITHFFNHQTHHRGQVHAMLTAAGQQPDSTDLPFRPET